MSYKNEIKKRSQFCAYCNVSLTDFKEKSIDHIRPKSKGGKAKAGNAVCACRKCNNQKADKDLKEWLTKARKNCLVIYLKQMKSWKKNYSELIFKKIREVF